MTSATHDRAQRARASPSKAVAGLVSVIIPTFNRATVISRPPSGALAQTHHNLEVIVVDDGSTDDTAEVVESGFGHDRRVHFIHRPRGGVAAARNTGLASVTGEFIAFLDSDDEWLPWKIELQLGRFAVAPQGGMIWTDFAAMSDSGQTLHDRYLRRMYRSMRSRSLVDLFAISRALGEAAPDCRVDLARATVYCGDVFDAMLVGSIVHTSTVMLRRDRALAVGAFNIGLRPSGEDYDYHLRTTMLGRVAFIDVPTARYTIGTHDQLTASDHMVDLARNGLRTIEAILASDNGRVGGDLARSAGAAAHGWLGRELVAAGELRSGRRYLWPAYRLGRDRIHLMRWAKSLIPRRQSVRERERVNAYAGSATTGVMKRGSSCQAQ